MNKLFIAICAVALLGAGCIDWEPAEKAAVSIAECQEMGGTAVYRQGMFAFDLRFIKCVMPTKK